MSYKWFSELLKIDINEVIEHIKSISLEDCTYREADFTPIACLVKGLLKEDPQESRKYIYIYIEACYLLGKSLDEMFKETNIPIRFWQDAREDYKNWKFGLDADHKRTAHNEVEVFINRMNTLSGKLEEITTVIKIAARDYYRFNGYIGSGRASNFINLFNKIQNTIERMELKKMEFLNKIGYFDCIKTSDENKAVDFINGPNVSDKDIREAIKQLKQKLANQ